MPQEGHPIFNKGSGAHQVSLEDQAAVLLCAIQNVGQAKCHGLTGVSFKPIARIYTKLSTLIACHVERHEKSIQYGGSHDWLDVEADECDVRRGMNPEEPNWPECQSGLGTMGRSRTARCSSHFDTSEAMSQEDRVSGSRTRPNSEEGMEVVRQ